MIKIENINLNKNNKKILDEYQLYLITVKYMNEDTSVSSYIEDLYKYLDYIRSEFCTGGEYKSGTKKKTIHFMKRR